MRLTLALSLLSLTTMTGCAGRFTGEWLEESKVLRDGSVVETTGPRRAAIRFDPIVTVRTGGYIDNAGVVDADLITWDSFVIYDNGRTAEFGSVLATLDGDRMTTYIDGQEYARFVRMRGRPSIFPAAASLKAQ